ncbi:MAG: hypothetical protein C0514_05165 [Candidatus Puniceispirillum sp.]|nr:hypothetical protein [Candidatus Puniceispirillum sp.]
MEALLRHILVIAALSLCQAKDAHATQPSHGPLADLIITDRHLAPLHCDEIDQEPPQQNLLHQGLQIDPKSGKIIILRKEDLLLVAEHFPEAQEEQDEEHVPPVQCLDPSTTDDDLEHLWNVTDLDLSHCPLITNKGLCFVADSVITINVSNCAGVTDAGVSKLAGAKSVNLSNCPITDKGVVFLTGAKRVNLSHCPGITGAAIQYVTNATILNLSHCPEVTDEDFALLTGTRILNVSNCPGVTDTGLKYLYSVQNLNINNCPEVTDMGLGYLMKIKTIYPSSLKTLSVSGCPKVTQGAKNTLRARGVKVID